MNDTAFLPSERTVFSLRKLYSSYGYRHYKVSKFEEYDLYANNKSFLTDSNILTFTDTDGRLLALKPDITLSIIKNTKNSGGMHKVYYNESVYRTNGGGFREIMQTGLECIGNIDMYCISEVLTLAYKSLEIMGNDFLLEISHMGFVSGLIDEITDNADIRDSLMFLLSQKNTDEIQKICNSIGKDPQMLCKACAIYGKPYDCLEKMRSMQLNEKMAKSIKALESIVDILKDSGIEDSLRFDFSMTNDMRYYNGIIFKGYVNGIPQSVLSGGRYDKVLKGFNKKGGAIGFAVYPSDLDRLCAGENKTDVDVLLIYDENTPPSLVSKKATAIIKSGKSVLAQSSTDNVCAGEIIDISGGAKQ